MPNKLYKSLASYNQTIPHNAEEITGLIGKPGSSRVVDVPGRNGFVYVRLRNTSNELIQAFNENVSPVYNLPVRVHWVRGRYEIIGRDVGRYADWGSQSSFLPKHGGQHSLSFENGQGGDVTWVYSRQFSPLATTPSGTSGAGLVYAYPHVYRNPVDASWNFIGNQSSPNLLPAKPTNNQARMLLLYWNLDTSQIEISTGSLLAANLTGTVDVLPYIPTLTNIRHVPMSAIRLVSGTVLIGWDNIYDMRQFSTTTPPSFAGGFAVTDEGVPVGTGTSLDFVGANVTASISGSVIKVYVTGSAGGGGGWEGQEYQQNGSSSGSGTVANFSGDRVSVSISGTVANIMITGAFPWAQYHGSNTTDIIENNSADLLLDLSRIDPDGLVILTGSVHLAFKEPGWYEVMTDIGVYPAGSNFFNGYISFKHYSSVHTGTSTFVGREMQYPTQETSAQNWHEQTLHETFYAQGDQRIRVNVSNATTGTITAWVDNMTIKKLGGRSTP